MARHFNGSSDKIQFAAGSTALLARGPLTYLAFVRFASNHRGGLIEATDGGFRKIGCNPFDNGHLFFSVNGSVGWNTWDYSTFLHEYVIVGFTKQAGNGATVTGHLWQGAAWDHEDLGTIDLAGGSTIDEIVMGVLGGDFLHADLAVAGLYDTALSNGDIEAAALDTTIAGWEDLNPAALWGFNQADAADPVPDRTGGGADSTTVTGTTITDDPVGFSFSTASTVTLDATLPALTAATTARSVVRATADAALPALTADLDGAATSRAALAATLPALTADVTGAASATAQLAATLPALTAHLSDGSVVPPGRGPITLRGTGSVTLLDRPEVSLR